MLVQVIEAFYDKDQKKALRKVGQLLNYKDEKRAKALIAKKLVVKKEITEVGNEQGKTTGKSGGNSKTEG